MNFINVKVSTEQEAMDVVNAMVLATGRMISGKFSNSKEKVNIVSLDYYCGIALFNLSHEDSEFFNSVSTDEYLNFVKENKDNPNYIKKMKDIQNFKIIIK